MMHIYFGWGLITIGLGFVFTAIVGLFRLPDFFTKLHAISVSDSFGLPLCYTGFIILNWPNLQSAKILFLFIIMLVLSPLNSHALAKAAFSKLKDNMHA